MRNINLRYVDEEYDEQGLLRRFRVSLPDDFNFAYDVVDEIAAEEPQRPAMQWCNPEGEEHLFTFQDMKVWSDKTARFLAEEGIGRGDMVMVILRRHYQFWFTATALHKLGAVMVPATFMLKEHDLSYRIQSAEVKAIICTDCGDIAQIADNVAPECPSLQKKILVAGNLHDVGKLVVPRSILEKPGKLTTDEFNIVKEHPYYTSLVLLGAEGFDDIRKWASRHHEKLHGRGYPFHFGGEALDCGDCIMGVADVFTAITEERPYRSGMPREKVAAILSDSVRNDELNGDLVDLLLDNYDQVDHARDEASRRAGKRYFESLSSEA